MHIIFPLLPFFTKIPSGLRSSVSASIISNPSVTLNDMTVSDKSTKIRSKEPKYSVGTGFHVEGGGLTTEMLVKKNVDMSDILSNSHTPSTFATSERVYSSCQIGI